MSKKKPFTVDDAYALETPADSVRLYGDWARTYDDDFAARSGYVQYRRVAEIFLQQQTTAPAPVLDVGCGTGLVGAVLSDGGAEVIDGVDISQPMLDEARRKTNAAGNPVYRRLLTADLTGDLDVDTDTYSGIVSAGTFTMGHLGPDTLDEMWRIAAPGAVCSISVRTTHFDDAGFGEKLDRDVQLGRIEQPELVEIPIYRPDSGNPEHANDRAYVIVCRVA